MAPCLPLYPLAEEDHLFGVQDGRILLAEFHEAPQLTQLLRVHGQRSCHVAAASPHSFSPGETLGAPNLLLPPPTGLAVTRRTVQRLPHALWQPSLESDSRSCRSTLPAPPKLLLLPRLLLNRPDSLRFWQRGPESSRNES